MTFGALVKRQIGLGRNLDPGFPPVVSQIVERKRN